jgi:heme exporter protein A
VKTSTRGLEACSLSVERGDDVVFEDLSFVCPPGTITHLKGENGSGKTTLLRTLAGLVQPSNGQVFWNGQILSGPNFIKTELVFIGHQSGLNAELNALENLQFIAGLTTPQNNYDIETALRRVRADKFESQPIRHLSAGQRQRIALARLLIQDATLWMLDEPFTAIDTETRRIVEGLLEEHVAKAGVVMLATHQEFSTQCKVGHITLRNKQ